MLIPIGTSVQTVRRVPYVTFTLMIVNALLCLYTSWAPDAGDRHFVEVKQAIVDVSAYYPTVKAHGDAAAIIAEAKHDYPHFYEHASHPDELGLREVPPIVAYIRSGKISADAAMERMEARLSEVEKESFLWKYAFHSYRPTPISVVSATFLHGGTLHLLGNMWFLYLAGTILEASWGYWLFAVVYLFGGIAALFVQDISQPDSFTFVLGASGAVAACMGAFLVRFPTVKVKMLWFMVWIFRVVKYEFSVPAIYILPIWLASEIVYAFFSPGSVAHWAHVGGFLFGLSAAVLIEKTGLERWINRKDELDTWHPDQPILDAVEKMEKGQNAEAAKLLRAYLLKHPGSMDGFETLLRAQQALNDREGQKETLGTLCRLDFKAGTIPELWRRYGDWIAVGGGPAEPTMWLELCRYLEREKSWSTAVEECERLATTYPRDARGFTAMLMAARMSLEKLNDPKQAKRLYQAAQKCEAKDLAMESLIDEGLKRCKQRTAQVAGR
jgi:membrane associated rhomboid family serine protease